MSTIGGLDWDLIQWKQPVVFNLELMKLAAYHKIRQQDFFQMQQAFSSDKFTKVYIRKDYEDFLYPKEITQDPKVEWGGLALTGGIYTPMNKEIETMPADTSIYGNLSRFYDRDGFRQSYKVMLEAQHLRLSHGKGELLEDWEKQLRKKDLADKKLSYFIFHDTDLFKTPDLGYLIKTIEKYSNGKDFVRYGSKFPLIAKTDADLDFLFNHYFIKGLSDIQLTEMLPIERLEQVVEAEKIQTFTLVISKDNWTESKFIASLPEIFLQAIFLSRLNISLLLKIDKKFSLSQQWHSFVKLFNSYIQNSRTYRKELNYCCFTYCKHAYMDISTEEKRELFQFVKDNNETLFSLLYGVEYVTLENGKLIPHLYTEEEIKKGGGVGGHFYKLRNQGTNRTV